MIEIEVYDIVLINIITYMSGIFTGLGLCIKYKHKLFRSTSQENLARLQAPVHNSGQTAATQDMGHSTIGQYPPIMASAPPASTLKEVVIRTTE